MGIDLGLLLLTAAAIGFVHALKGIQRLPLDAAERSSHARTGAPLSVRGLAIIVLCE